MTDLFERISNRHISFFFFHCFVFPDNFSVRIGSPLLLHGYFHIKLQQLEGVNSTSIQRQLQPYLGMGNSKQKNKKTKKRKKNKTTTTTTTTIL